MSRRKSHAFSDLITGIFMLTVLALLGYFTIVISGIDIIRGKERVKATVAFTEVGGLKDHDAVMYRGTKVGTVEKISLCDDGLKVLLDIDKSVKIRKGYNITVCALTMLGGNYLQITEGEGEEIDYLTTELKGEPPTDWMRDMTQIAKDIKEFTQSGEVRAAMEDIRSITAKCNAIVTRVEAGEGMAGRILSNDDTLYKDVMSTVAEAKSAVAHANAISERFDDEKIVEELKSGIAAFKKACESMDLGDTVETVKDDVKDFTASAKQLLATLTEIADRAKRGEGTVGKLLKEDGMYNEVEGLILDVRQVLDNYRDTTPISTFSSLATGAL